MSQRPHSSATGHDGEMSCETLLAALDDVAAKRITPLDYVILGFMCKGSHSRAEIARDAGCAPTSVPRSMKRLAACGLISWTKGGGRGNGSTFGVVENCNRRPEDTVLNRRPEENEVPTDTVSAVNCAPEVSETAINRRRAASVSALKTLESQKPSESPGAGAGAKTLNNLDDTNTKLYPDRVEFDFDNCADASARPAKVLNGHAIAMSGAELAIVVVDHVNSPFLDPHKSLKLSTSAARFGVWMTAGADFDADILPTIKFVMANQREAVRTWTYFDEPIRKAIAERKAAEQPMEPMNGQSSKHSDDIRIRREPVSAATAARLQRRADRASRSEPIDLGRLASVRID